MPGMGVSWFKVNFCSAPMSANAFLLWLRRPMEIITLKPRPKAAELAIAT